MNGEPPESRPAAKSRRNAAGVATGGQIKEDIMTKLVKTTLAGVALAVALGGTARAQETVAIGELSWDGQRAISYVIKAVIELRLGGKA